MEAAYQQDQISLKEVDARVAELRAELARERRVAFTYFLHGWKHWLGEQRETLIGIAILAFVTYAWVLTSLSSSS